MYCDRYNRSEHRGCEIPEKGILFSLGVKKVKRGLGRDGSQSCKEKRNELSKRNSNRCTKNSNAFTCTQMLSPTPVHGVVAGFSVGFFFPLSQKRSMGLDDPVVPVNQPHKVLGSTCLQSLGPPLRVVIWLPLLQTSQKERIKVSSFSMASPLKPLPCQAKLLTLQCSTVLCAHVLRG